MPNRLSGETSPYLFQHADNPVDWYPWGDEAFKRAQTEDKPILLSVGYSACHWCHVMAHESFQNSAIAEIMNRHFVNIKVDREERPDVDHIYMEAVQTLTGGGGGWPLTVFLTPQLKPFFGGTYFPPQDQQNLPAFPRVLLSVADAYKNRREMIEQATQDISRALAGRPNVAIESGELDRSVLDQAVASLQTALDRENGGFGGAPKFPHPMTLEFLLRFHLRQRDSSTLEMVKLTLDKMAMGGIYDQIGGGFHRYATDRAWQVPHFEKMLYDNALLSRIYLQAWAVTGYEPYARIGRETLDYLLREMRDGRGGFYSTEDADSEGEEGKYYIWTANELEKALGASQVEQVKSHFGVTAAGNFEGRNILHVASLEAAPKIEEARKSLLAERGHRIKPARDEKMLASWNGLTLISLSEAAGGLKRQDYRLAAEANARFILEYMVVGGVLMHTFKDGRAKIPGFLEDYALTGLGLLALNGLTADLHWLESAIALTKMMVDNFEDLETGLLYDAPSRQADLFIRPRNEFDGATPAGTSAAAMLLFKMAVVTGEEHYRDMARRGLAGMRQAMVQSPLGVSQWLCDLDFALAPDLEIVVAGEKDDIRTRSLLEAVNSEWLPQAVVVGFNPDQPGTMRELSLFRGRGLVNGHPAVYICRNNSCQAPITEVEELRRELSNPSLRL
jgi:uncharacterized protein YyaL (SSP411 family)